MCREPCHEVTTVQHCWLKVGTMTKPMGLSEEQEPFKGPGSG